MPSKRRFDLIALCASILCASILCGPAAADIRYTFTSDQGSFVYDSVSFFEGGSLSAGDLVRYSGDFEDVYFGNSYILLVNADCKYADDCFDATFGLSGIFQTTRYLLRLRRRRENRYLPNRRRRTNSRAFLMGLAGGRFRRPRLREEPKNLEAAPATERPIADAAGVARACRRTRASSLRPVNRNSQLPGLLAETPTSS